MDFGPGHLIILWPLSFVIEFQVSVEMQPT
jgi:hypothetical protein